MTIVAASIAVIRTGRRLETERRTLLEVSHELRSPITRLGLAVELLRDGDVTAEALERIGADVARLGTLADSLLDVVSPVRGRAERLGEDVVIDALVAEIADASRMEAAARDCRIVVVGRTSSRVRGSRELLRRAIENVLRNAVRFAPAGTNVDVQLSTRDRQITIAVRDCGPGVPEKTLARLFDPFFRVNGPGNEPGTGMGLGLAIARRAVMAHQGRVEAVNAYPGLRVEITLATLAGPG